MRRFPLAVVECDGFLKVSLTFAQIQQRESWPGGPGCLGSHSRLRLARCRLFLLGLELQTDGTLSRAADLCLSFWDMHQADGYSKRVRQIWQKVRQIWQKGKTDMAKGKTDIAKG